jgi:hypothetical protein
MSRTPRAECDGTWLPPIERLLHLGRSHGLLLGDEQEAPINLKRGRFTAIRALPLKGFEELVVNA